MNLKCLAIDDEPLALRVIEKFAADISYLDLVGKCSNAIEALEVLENQKIDLLFIDINMPKMSGISMVKSMRQSPAIIFTTAYAEYAVEGFDLEAVDYLLKPFSFERFMKAVARAKEKLSAITNKEKAADYLLIKSDKKLYKIDFQEIRYLQAYGDYVKIFTTNKTLLTKDRLANLESKLPENLFLKIHRSYVIALNAIEFIEGNQVKIGADKLPIAISFKERLLNKLNP